MADDAFEPTELLPDTPPKDGTWVDNCDVVGALTDEEIAAGNALGDVIDTDNDDDNGDL